MGDSFARDLSPVLLLMDPGWSDACEQSTDSESHENHLCVARTEGGSCFCGIQPSVSTVLCSSSFVLFCSMQNVRMGGKTRRPTSPKACWSSFKVNLRIGLAA